MYVCMYLDFHIQFQVCVMVGPSKKGEREIFIPRLAFFSR